MQNEQHKHFGPSSVVDELTESLPDLREAIDQTIAVPGAGTKNHSLASTVAEIPSGVQLIGEQVDSSLPRYERIGVLGKGGLGEVLEVRDRDLHRIVALKRPRGLHVSPSNMTRLVLEAQVTAQLDHPNIPPIHELGVDPDGVPFFVMARIQGKSLGELLDERKQTPEVNALFSVSRSIRIVLQIAYALSFAHERGVVHRDIKPDNIFIGNFGQVYVMDWGIAKVQGRPDGGKDDDSPDPIETVDFETQARGFVGSVSYASPEQIRGVADIDCRSDIYSLSALLFTMLAGRPPVVASSARAVAAEVLVGDVTPLRELVPVPEQLAAVVHHGLQTDRDDRYSSVSEFITDLEAILEGRPVSVFEETQAKRLKRWYFGRPAWLFRMQLIDLDMVIGAWMFLALALGIWLAMWKPDLASIVALVGVVLFILFNIRPTYTLLRRPHPDDPDVLHVLGDLTSMTTDHSQVTSSTHLPPRHR